LRPPSLLISRCCLPQFLFRKPFCTIHDASSGPLGPGPARRRWWRSPTRSGARPSQRSAAHCSVRCVVLCRACLQHASCDAQLLLCYSFCWFTLIIENTFSGRHCLCCAYRSVLPVACLD
jgi:hypothetical protein